MKIFGFTLNKFIAGSMIFALPFIPGKGNSTETKKLRVPSAEIRLTLKESMAITLKNNLDISIERINPLIAETEIIKSESEFDSVLSLSGTAKKTRKQSASAFANPPVGESEGYDVSIGVGSKLVSGTELNMDLASGRVITNSSFQGLNPQYGSSVNLSLTQHLLKDFGIDVNRSSIRIAEKSREGSALKFKEKVINTLAQVQNVYWDLVLAIEDQKVKKETFDLAKQFEKRVRIQVKVGVMAPIEITQARAEVASREEDVIITENHVRDVEDRLRRLLNIDSDSWGQPIVPTDSPTVGKRLEQIEDDLFEAFENRPDYLFAKTIIESRRIELQYKDNQLYPTLDLIGTFQLNGISGDAVKISTFGGTPSQSSFGGNYRKSMDNAFSGNYYNWQVGLTLSFPFGNRKPKSEYTASKLEVEKMIKTLKNIEQQITLEVREAVRKIETSLKRIQATRVSSELAEEKLDAEEKKFEVGMSTSFNVLEYQRDLSIARSRELLALADYSKSQVNLDVAKGTLLEENQIYLSPDPLSQ